MLDLIYYALIDQNYDLHDNTLEDRKIRRLYAIDLCKTKLHESDRYQRNIVNQKMLEKQMKMYDAIKEGGSTRPFNASPSIKYSK
ncbi:unnamed protein product [Rhizophagus irregularis]|nr:unnamed protein product [Rhizophagus irregularis]